MKLLLPNTKNKKYEIRHKLKSGHTFEVRHISNSVRINGYVGAILINAGVELDSTLQDYIEVFEAVLKDERITSYRFDIEQDHQPYAETFIPTVREFSVEFCVPEDKLLSKVTNLKDKYVKEDKLNKGEG